MTGPIRKTPADGSVELSWHRLEAEEALSRLGSGYAGLDEAEAARRLETHGANALREARGPRPLAILAGQFKSLIVWILIGAAAVSEFLGEWVDFSAILAIVVLNALIGFYQEFNAERSLAALRRMTAPRCRVRRGGKSLLVEALAVVPGDILEVEAGDLVAADARIVEAASLKAVESALTGESEPVRKDPASLPSGEVPLGDRTNMLFAGTSVATGTGLAVAVATGMKTELGRIARLIQEASAEEETPLQRRLAAFGKILVWASLGIVGLVFVLGWLRRIPLLELFITSVSLAVAAVPEGLPAVVTIALAVGVQRMARRRSLIRRLASVETLGSTNVICSDKTGTLTVGEMTVRTLYVDGSERAVTGEGYAPEGSIGDGTGAKSLRRLLEVFVGCNGARLSEENGAWKTLGDPTEGALLAVGAKGGVRQETLETEQPKVREHPFDSDRKRMSVVRRAPGGRHRALVKGAPDTLLERCSAILEDGAVRPLSEADRKTILKANEAMADRALRVLAAAYKETEGPIPAETDLVERDLVFIGLAGMQDPPRSEAREAVSLCQSAGIRVVMITGDHPKTGLAIARELGIARTGDEALAGLEMDRLSDEALAARLERTSVYARVTAAHKLRIVRAWKERGAVVAMTGDGVNDAPAIKGADIGVAMGRTGTEVTKEASDMVVTDDNFASIVAAVEEGRGIYDNIRKTLLYLLSGNAGELLVMLACVLGGVPIPLLPIHLLWINLVTDGLPALCLATDPIDPDVMRRLPRRRTDSLTDRKFLKTMVLTGLLTGGVTLAVYLWVLPREGLAAARSQAFSTLVLAELLRAFGCRSETRPVWRAGGLSNLRLAAVVVASIAFQIWSHHEPFLGRFFGIPRMTWTDCARLLAVSAIPLWVLELRKVFARSFSR